MAPATINDVNKYYQSQLGRPSDAEGGNWYLGKINESETDSYDLAWLENALKDSPEYQQRLSKLASIVKNADGTFGASHLPTQEAAAAAIGINMQGGPATAPAVNTTTVAGGAGSDTVAGGNAGTVTPASTQMTEADLNNVYMKILGRPVDASGVSTYLGLINQSQVDDKDAEWLAGVLKDSSEYTKMKSDLTAQVTKLYGDNFGSTKDTAGIKYYVEQVLADGTDNKNLDWATKDIQASDQAKSYTGQKGTATHAYQLTPKIVEAYRQLGYEPTQEAVDYWLTTIPQSESGYEQSAIDEYIAGGATGTDAQNLAQYKSKGTFLTDGELSNIEKVYQDILGRSIDSTGFSDYSKYFGSTAKVESYDEIAKYITDRTAIGSTDYKNQTNKPVAASGSNVGQGVVDWALANAKESLPWASTDMPAWYGDQVKAPIDQEYTPTLAVNASPYVAPGGLTNQPISTVGLDLSGDTKQDIINAYTTLLGRAPDAEGLASYLAKIDADPNDNVDANWLLKDLAASAEGKQYATMQGPNALEAQLSGAAKSAYDQTISTGNNVYSANGLYGSQGFGTQGQFITDAGKNYDTGLLNAKVAKNQLYASDLDRINAQNYASYNAGQTAADKQTNYDQTKFAWDNANANTQNTFYNNQLSSKYSADTAAYQNTQAQQQKAYENYLALASGSNPNTSANLNAQTQASIAAAQNKQSSNNALWQGLGTVTGGFLGSTAGSQAATGALGTAWDWVKGLSGNNSTAPVYETDTDVSDALAGLANQYGGYT